MSTTATTPATAWPAGKLIETFPIRLPDDTRFEASLHRCATRNSGRRIIVRDGSGIVFDTDECYDLGNATNKLDLWLRQYIEPADRQVA